MGDYAFNACDNLASITIQNSATKIGTDAFTAYTSLVITCPNNPYAHKCCLKEKINVWLTIP
ncbi:MAG: leucine-rich repeat domain-containing protein [Dehalococcoidia bacterium]|nr:leucine-rich repeat domain-containing protein [Dehalococcoidia bacterium]